MSDSTQSTGGGVIGIVGWEQGVFPHSLDGTVRKAVLRAGHRQQDKERRSSETQRLGGENSGGELPIRTRKKAQALTGRGIMIRTHISAPLIAQIAC